MHNGLRWAVILLVACCTASLAAAATTTTIPLPPDETAFRMVDATREALSFEITVGELTALEVSTPAGDFDQLFIPGFHRSQQLGAPALPMMNRLINLPLGAAPEVVVESTETQVIDLAAAGIEHPLLPAQPSVAKHADPAALPFELDRAAYDGRATFAPELARVVDTGQLRGLRIGRLEIAPVTYDPVAGTLTVTTRLRLSVRFPGADWERDAAEKARTYSPFFEPVYDRVLGYRSEHDSHPDLMTGPVKYVIVADRMFQSQLQPFIEWKTRQGFAVIESYTDEIGSSTSAIRDYLSYLYLTEVPAPTFVLFVGDTAQIPAFNQNGPTDRLYCDVSGDLAPEMYYGRFSARNTAELQPQIDKTLEYEQFLMPDPSYLGEAVMIAGYDPNYGATYGNGQINYGTNLYFNAAHGILSHTYLYPESGSSASQIHQDVSNGVAFANYTAHGSETAWSNPSFTRTDIDNLQNAHEYCLAIGNCCLTSTFSYGDCFAEHWLRAANKGAIGYIGGANSTYWDEDYWWGVGYGPVIGGGPTYQQTGLGVYDGLFHDHGEGIGQWYVVQDAIIFCGNLAVQEAGSSLTSYYWNVYNLMGDPSLNPHLGVPTPNDVTYADTLPPEGGGGSGIGSGGGSAVDFVVSAEPNSYVGISKGGVLVGCGLVEESGSATISCSGQGTSGTATIVVTCHNKVPYMAEIPIGSTTGVASAAAPTTAIRLERNAPNPFNPQTTFRLALPAAQAVSLRIYDLQGRRVRELLDGMAAAGDHRIVWDGRADDGRSLPSGVYLARFTSATHDQSWKVVLAK